MEEAIVTTVAQHSSVAQPTTRGPLSTAVTSAPPLSSTLASPNQADHVIEYQKLKSPGYSPINVEQLSVFLLQYPNREHAKLLENGFKHGFELGYYGERKFFDSKNLKSAEVNPAIVLDKINKEIQAGRMAGPFTELPFSDLHISPLGLVPKSDGGHRLITHLSFPRKTGGINGGIKDEIKTVSYTSFDKVVDMILDLGPNCLLAKRDIKSAFRLLPINPCDFNLLGMKVQGAIYIDLNLPFGVSCAPFYFEVFSTFIHWLVKTLSGLPSLDHYLDDFIFGWPDETNDCGILLKTFHTICNGIGVPINEEKSVGPTTVLIFLGLEIDSCKVIIRIPLVKIEELKSLLSRYVNKKKITLGDLQSLVGKLCFFGQAIRSSRAFLRRFYDSMSGLEIKFYKLRITQGMREDFLMWLSFLSEFNGLCPISEKDWYENENLQLFTDSAGSAELGCGCFFNGKWAFFQWPKHWIKDNVMKDITFLEMVPVVLAVYLWAPLLANKRIIFRIDNLALVSIINKQTAKSKRVMKLVRRFVLKCMQFNIFFKAMHIDTHANEIADSISRKQWQRFHRLAPLATRQEQLPENFLSLISEMKVDD